jgi:DNA-binding winged helix-turn-helix (wHTH) protein
MRAAQSSPLPAPAADARQRRPPLSFGPYTFDPNSRLLSRDGTEVPLPPRVLGVLELLLQRAGEVVNRQELIDSIWKDAFVTDTSLAEAVSVLRQALRDDPQSPTFIQTLHRRGYRFVAPVSSADAPQIKAAAEEPVVGAANAVSPSIGKELVPWGLAAIAICIAAAAAWQLTRAGRGEPGVSTRFAVAAAPGTAFDASAPALAISRDGTRIAWSACDTPAAAEPGSGSCRLYVRALDRLEPSPLSGVEGRAPFFSPDGRWLGYFADGRLMKVALAGGAPTTIADAPTPLGGVWIDRDIVFAGSPSGGLQRVSADGGEARPLTRPREGAGEIRHVWPAIVPGTRIVIFTIDTSLADPSAGAPGALAVLSLDTLDGHGEAPGWRTLLAGASIARAASPDALVFARDTDLHAVWFDAARLAISGTPRAIASGLATARGRAQFALSPVGTLVYAEDAAASSPPMVLQPPSSSSSPSSSWPFPAGAVVPDGSRVAGVKVEDTRTDIWIAETGRSAATRLTHTGANTAPIWSADGRTVYFAARGTGPYEIWRRDADGGGAAAPVHASARHAFPLATSPDGASLAFLQTGERTRADIWLLPLGGGAGRALVEGPLDEGAASFSPDSTMLAFESAETGRWEVYVVRLRDGRRVLVSTNGGRRPLWTREGLLFQSGPGVMKVSIAAEGEELRVEDSSRVDTIDGELVGLAGDRRYVVTRAAAAQHVQANVVLGWLRELRALLGPPVAEPPR